MDKQEKRFIRRELINGYIHRLTGIGVQKSFCLIKTFVRADEVHYYGRSLRLYYPKGK